MGLLSTSSFPTFAVLDGWPRWQAASSAVSNPCPWYVQDSGIDMDESSIVYRRARGGLCNRLHTGSGPILPLRHTTWPIRTFEFVAPSVPPCTRPGILCAPRFATRSRPIDREIFFSFPPGNPRRSASVRTFEPSPLVRPLLSMVSPTSSSNKIWSSPR